MSDKLIKECPVCKSTNIVQDQGHTRFSMDTVIGIKSAYWRDGSHCENCGCKFVFNHISVDEFRNNRTEDRFNND